MTGGATADVYVAPGEGQDFARYIRWDGDVLRRELSRDAALQRSLDVLVGLTLADKLHSATDDGAEVVARLREVEVERTAVQLALQLQLEVGVDASAVGSAAAFYAQLGRYCQQHNVPSETRARALRGLGLEPEDGSSRESLAEVCAALKPRGPPQP